MFNSKVAVHKTGFRKDVGYVSDAVLAKEILKNYKTREDNATNNALLESANANYKSMELANKVESRRSLEHKKEFLMEKSFSKCREVLMTDVMFDIFKDSLPLDDDFVNTNENMFRTIIGDYMNSQGGFKFVQERAEVTNSPLLKSMVAIVEKCARRNTMRKRKKDATEENIETFDFSLEKEEKEEFFNDKKDLDVEAISEVVKDKVIDVIKDESSRQKKQAEFEKDLADDMNLDANDKQSIKEAAQAISINKPVTEQTTLFDGLFRETYKTVLQEGNENVDMDEIFAETITKYTLMEMAYTIHLSDFRGEQLRKSIEKMIQ